MASEARRLSLCARIDQRLLTSSPTVREWSAFRRPCHWPLDSSIEYISSNDKKRVVAPPLGPLTRRRVKTRRPSATT